MSNNSQTTSPMGIDRGVLSEHLDSIALLSKSNNILRHELMLEGRQRRMMEDEGLKKSLKTLRGNIEEYTRRNRAKEHEIAELAEKIKWLQKRKMQQDNTRGGSVVTRVNNKNIASQIQVLESRINTQLVAFNCSISDNKQSRDRIDLLITDRATFDKIYSRMGMEVWLTNNEIKTLNSQVVTIKTERDSVKQELRRLVKESETKTHEFEDKWQNRGRVLEDERFKLDGVVKVTNRPVDETVQVGSLTQKDEQNLRSNLQSKKWFSVSTKRHIQSSQEKAEQIQEFFDQLQEVTGIREADDLAELFLHFEERIFDLVKEINICNESIEEVKQEIAALQLTQSKIESSTRQTNKHKEAVLNTKRMLLSAEELAKKSKENQQMLSQIEGVIEEVDQVINTGKSKTVKDMTTEPVMKKLGMIEMYIRNQLAAKNKRAGMAKSFRNPKGKGGASFGKDSKAEVQLHKRLITDDIFKEDWSSEDSEANDGAGIFPHSWHTTSKIVQRHFKNKKRRPTGSSHGKTRRFGRK